MICIILAAGKNLRLNSGQPKSFLSINGQSLLERHIDQFEKIGVTKFAIITGFHHDALLENINHLKQKSASTIDVIYNEKFELENGYSLYKAKEWVAESGSKEFFFTMADHYYDEGFMNEFLSKSKLETPKILKLAVDIPDIHNEHIDLEDVTKVDASDTINNIGKEITSYNYYDTGLFFAQYGVFSVLDEIAKNDKLTISNLVTKLSEDKKAGVEEVVGYYWNDIDTPEDFINSKKVLEKN